MAYVPERTRVYLSKMPLDGIHFSNSDELTYCVIKLATMYAEQSGESLQTAIGLLESAKQEIFRKHLNPAAAQAEFDHGN